MKGHVNKWKKNVKDLEEKQAKEAAGQTDAPHTAQAGTFSARYETEEPRQNQLHTQPTQVLTQTAAGAEGAGAEQEEDTFTLTPAAGTAVATDQAPPPKAGKKAKAVGGGKGKGRTKK
jgi:hypothetical protein